MSPAIVSWRPFLPSEPLKWSDGCAQVGASWLTCAQETTGRASSCYCCCSTSTTQQSTCLQMHSVGDIYIGTTDEEREEEEGGQPCWKDLLIQPSREDKARDNSLELNV
jgi:hypothetical protein